MMVASIMMVEAAGSVDESNMSRLEGTLNIFSPNYINIFELFRE